ncbi:uncharacterized protein LOC143180055 [Calliopsis andreniformis]|uniref:uncharacterized protein LOC143180055 n=1 Tax=Calliopsis andreniformis TaxID=337506 RepID=UPI003FCDCF3A
MRRILLLLACAALVHSGPSKKQARDHGALSYEYEPSLGGIELSYAEPLPALPAGPLITAAPVPRKPGQSVGGPLVSIAKGAAEQAHTQLSNQQNAAGQAAYEAKNTLAQAAVQSAATAAAALAGKQIVVQGLEQQSRDAHVAVDGEQLQLQQAERSANAARTTAKQAMQQLQVIQAALNSAQSTSDRAAQAAAEAAAELAAQTTMLGQAKARAETLDEQLTAARLDYESTQAAAQKAATAAAAAQNNAAAAAAHVADNAATSALLQHAPQETQLPVKLPQNPLLRAPVGHADPAPVQEPAGPLLSPGLFGKGGPLGGPIALDESSAILAAEALSKGGPLGPGAGLDESALLAAGVLGKGGPLGPVGLDESALLASGALQKLGPLRGPIRLDESSALLAAGGLQKLGPLRGPGPLVSAGGLQRSELLSLANALPADGYELKGYRY